MSARRAGISGHAGRGDAEFPEIVTRDGNASHPLDFVHIMPLLGCTASPPSEGRRQGAQYLNPSSAPRLKFGMLCHTVPSGAAAVVCLPGSSRTNASDLHLHSVGVELHSKDDRGWLSRHGTRPDSLYAVCSLDEPRLRIQGNDVFQHGEICVCIEQGEWTDESPAHPNPGLAVSHSVVSLLEVCCHG